MITKQERFKKFLAGDYDTYVGLDDDLKRQMAGMGWIHGNGRMNFSPRSQPEVAYHGGEAWHRDIRLALGNLQNVNT